MFIHLLLILPTIEAANLLIKEFSIKQVSIDDNVIKKLFLNSPIDVETLRQRGQFRVVPQPSMGMLGPKKYPIILNTTPKPTEKFASKIPKDILKNLPVFVNSGLKRFKKIHRDKVTGQHVSRNGLKMDAKDGVDSNSYNRVRTIIIHVVDSLPRNEEEDESKDTFLNSAFELATKA